MQLHSALIIGARRCNGMLQDCCASRKAYSARTSGGRTRERTCHDKTASSDTSDHVLYMLESKSSMSALRLQNRPV